MEGRLNENGNKASSRPLCPIVIELNIRMAVCLLDRERRVGEHQPSHKGATTADLGW